MKILVVSQYFWPENFRINELVAELIKRGHEVTVLTGMPNYPEGTLFEDFERDPSRFGTFEGATVLRVPMMVRGKGKLRLLLNYLTYAFSASVIGAWKLRGQPFDVIFVCQLSPVTVGIPSALLRWLKGIPQVFWILDLWPESLKAVGIVKKPWMLGLVGSLVSWIYARCDLILAQSKSFVADIASNAPAGKRIEYFPAWAEATFDVVHTQDVSPAPELTLAPEMFTIVFAGNVGEAQDFPAILNAVEILKDRADIRWVIVGDGRMAPWVRGQIQSRGLSDRVQMVGRFPLERMPSFFMHADALLVSLRDEAVFAMTIPGKLQSYLAAGIPVVAMLNGEGAQIVEEARAGLVCQAGDGEGLAALVEKMVAMPTDEREAMGRNGRRLCEQEFDRVQLVNRLEAWLTQIVKPSRTLERGLQ